MFKRFILYTLYLSVFVILSACTEASGTVTENESVVDENSEHRIVSTTVAITEIMDQLDLDLVGIPTTDKQLPERYEGVTEVGFVKKPDVEIIKWLNPTDVLNVSTLKLDLSPVYEDAGIEASFLNLDRVDNMMRTIEELGEKYDRKQQASEIVSKIQGKIDSIRKEVEGKEQPTVLILMGVPGSYLVATENSYIGDLVNILGGKNVVQGETVEYVASNTEYLQQANPDIILRAAHGMPEEVVEMFDQEFRENDIWKHFNAVKNNRVYDLEEAIFGTTASLRVVEAFDVLKEMLYPENE